MVGKDVTHILSTPAGDGHCKQRKAETKQAKSKKASKLIT